MLLHYGNFSYPMAQNLQGHLSSFFFLPDGENSTQKTLFERLLFLFIFVHIKKKLMLGSFHFFKCALKFCEKKNVGFTNQNL